MSGEASESSPRGSPPSSPSSAGLAGPGPGPLISAPAAPCSSGPGLPRSSGESPQAAPACRLDRPHRPPWPPAHGAEAATRRSRRDFSRQWPAVLRRLGVAGRDAPRPAAVDSACCHRAVSSYAYFLHRAVSYAYFLCWCPSGTSLHLHAVDSACCQIARTHRIFPVPSATSATSKLAQMPHIPQIAPSSSSLNHLNAPLVRCSRRLAAQAELTGGSRVYNRDDRTS